VRSNVRSYSVCKVGRIVPAHRTRSNRLAFSKHDFFVSRRGIHGFDHLCANGFDIYVEIDGAVRGYVGDRVFTKIVSVQPECTKRSACVKTSLDGTLESLCHLFTNVIVVKMQLNKLRRHG
jgi:hypothetical protein